MNRIQCLFGAALLGLVLCPVRAGNTNAHVLVITIDGFPAYEFVDPNLKAPALRKLAENGISAKGMIISTPAVTWPNHTTIVTGVTPAKHGVLFNGVLHRPGGEQPAKIEPNSDKSELVRVPTVYDFLHAKGYRTAGINWPCTRNVTTLDDNFPDVPQMISHSTPRLINELVGQGILNPGTDDVFDEKTGPERDDIWTAAACNSIRLRKPNAMFIHLLVVDGVQHRFGPESKEAYEALEHADKNVGQILAALDSAGIRESTTVFVTADHGFAKVRTNIFANAALVKAGLAETDQKGTVTRARVQAIPEGGTAFVYLNSPENAKKDQATVVNIFEKTEGIERVVTSAEYGRLGMPLPQAYKQSPDLILVARDGYGFANGTTGEVVQKKAQITGSHGYLASNPKMNAVFIVSGRGVRKGAQLEYVRNVDIAPTTAYLLAEKFPGDGKVLKRIFDPGVVSPK